MPRNPPIAPVRTEAIDSPPSPHNDGMKPPSVDPTTSPIMISDFEFIAIASSMKEQRVATKSEPQRTHAGAPLFQSRFQCYEGFLV